MNPMITTSSMTFSYWLGGSASFVNTRAIRGRFQRISAAQALEAGGVAVRCLLERDGMNPLHGTLEHGLDATLIRCETFELITRHRWADSVGRSDQPDVERAAVGRS